MPCDLLTTLRKSTWLPFSASAPPTLLRTQSPFCEKGKPHAEVLEKETSPSP